jgi:hypothetical protein
MVAAGVLARSSARVSRLVALVIAISVLPVGAYTTTLKQLPVSNHPLRSASTCIQNVQARGGGQPGLYVNLPHDFLWHPLYYYFRRVQPWIRSHAQSAAALNRYLYDPAEWRPVLIGEEYYRQFVRRDGSGVRAAGTSPAMIAVFDVIVLLPGPYAECGPGAARTAQ